MALLLGDFCMARMVAMTCGSKGSWSPLEEFTTVGHSSRKASSGSAPRPSLPMARAASR